MLEKEEVNAITGIHRQTDFISKNSWMSFKGIMTTTVFGAVVPSRSKQQASLLSAGKQLHPLYTLTISAKSATQRCPGRY